MALDQWSRPGVFEPGKVEIFGVRPNSPITTTNVVSSIPRSSRSSIRVATTDSSSRPWVVNCGKMLEW